MELDPAAVGYSLLVLVVLDLVSEGLRARPGGIGPSVTTARLGRGLLAVVRYTAVAMLTVTLAAFALEIPRADGGPGWWGAVALVVSGLVLAHNTVVDHAVTDQLADERG